MNLILRVFTNASEDPPHLVRHYTSWYCFSIQLKFSTSFLLSIFLNTNISIRKHRKNL